MTDNPHQFTRDAWEANADVWDSRMGDEGNDFFKMTCSPVLDLKKLAKCVHGNILSHHSPSI